MLLSLTEVRAHRLANGLRILLWQDRTVPLVTSMLWYGVGSRMECRGQTGIAHFLEHMMFRGTRGRPGGAIDLVTAVNGGHNNAFTSFDHTAYFFSFASDRWQVALELEADRMANLSLDEDAFETERQVILEEIRMTRDNPWEPLRETVDSAAFGEHPYGRPVIGLAEDVAAITRTEMESFYRRYYHPANAVLALAGDFDPEEALDRVRQEFESIPPAAPIPLPAEPPSRRPGQFLAKLDRPGEVPRLLVALPAPPLIHPDAAAHHLLDNLLAGGKLSRLYRRLVEEEKVVSVLGTDIEETVFPYHFLIRAELTGPGLFSRALDALFDELRRLGREPVDEEELERARQLSLVGFLQDHETTFDRAHRAGLFELLDGREFWMGYETSLLRVKVEEVMTAARRYADPDLAFVAWAEGRV